ncbi:MAG: hypothetical protein KC656_37325, partial [Myxococcales bacterium]|nr:hypothetical protein [Myxococcales bacterium]
MRFALIALLASVLSTTAFAAPNPPRKSPTEIYEHGLKMMRRGLYTRALEDFNRVRNYHRDDPIS